MYNLKTDWIRFEEDLRKELNLLCATDEETETIIETARSSAIVEVDNVIWYASSELAIARIKSGKY